MEKNIEHDMEAGLVKGDVGGVYRLLAGKNSYTLFHEYIYINIFCVCNIARCETCLQE